MSRLNICLVAVCATILLCGCGASSSSTETRTASSSKDTPVWPGCVSMKSADTVVTFSTGTGCAGCSISHPELVADGDPSTAAVLSYPAAIPEAVSIQVARTKFEFPPGNRAGVVLESSRLVSATARLRMQTYLDETLQEEMELKGEPTVTDGDTHFFTLTATKPFNAIAVVGDSVATSDGSLKIYETCSDVVSFTSTAHSDIPMPKAAGVVADLSTGTNPYHEAFRRPSWTEHPSKVIPGFPADAPVLDLTFGPDLKADIAADADKWSNLKNGVFYWIRGTNLIYVRTRDSSEAFPGSAESPAYETANHGVYTSGALSSVCSDCYLLVVSDPEGGFTYSLDFITQRAPWVDVASSTQIVLSGSPGGAPVAVQDVVLSPLLAPASPLASAAKRWVGAGHLFFVPTSNTPVAGFDGTISTDHTVPPWFTTVGGAHLACHASEFMAGKPAEFVTEYSTLAPADNSITKFQELSGTSFSSPFLATRFAQVLKRVRESLGDAREPGAYWVGPKQNSTFLADGRLTPEDLYQAFAEGASLFATSDYLAGECPAYPVPVSATPWVEMGWGYVGDDEVELVSDLILGKAKAPSKPADQATYMNAWLSARKNTGSLTP